MFGNLLKYLVGIGHTLLADLGVVFGEAVSTAVSDLDTMVRKYTPIAVAQVQAAATDPGLLSSAEKRSAVATKLVEQLESDGHDIEAEGFEAFVNLLVETGVNLVKVLTGQSLAQSSPAAKSA